MALNVGAYLCLPTVVVEYTRCREIVTLTYEGALEQSKLLDQEFLVAGASND